MPLHGVRGHNGGFTAGSVLRLALLVIGNGRANSKWVAGAPGIEPVSPAEHHPQLDTESRERAHLQAKLELQQSSNGAPEQPEEPDSIRSRGRFCEVRPGHLEWRAE